MVKILFVAKRYYTNKDVILDKYGRLYHIPMQLDSIGNSVEVVLLDYKNYKPNNMVDEGVRFITIPAKALKLFLVPFLLFKKIRQYKPDIIIASGDSHIGFLSMIMAKMIKSRFFFDVYDYYPVFAGNRLLGMKAMFKSAVVGSEAVLCASQPLLERMNELNNSVFLLANGVDRKLFRPENKLEVRKNLSIPEGLKVVGYFGSITHQRGPILIEACRILRKEFPDLRLLLAGALSEVRITEDWIDYRGVLPQLAIPGLIAACDVVTVPYQGDEFNNMAGACKVAEYLACERPVVATRIGWHINVFQKVPSSLCDPDPEGMAVVLRKQFEEPTVAPFPREFAWDAIVDELNNLFHKRLTY